MLHCKQKLIVKFMILFRVGSKMNNWKLYPGALMEIARVTRVEKGRACLLTQDKKCINKVSFVVISLILTLNFPKITLKIKSYIKV